MPAEASRLTRRIGRRDRRFLTALATAAAAGIAAAVALGGVHSSPAVSEACVTLDQAGVMGGGTWRFCGDAAAAYCRAHAAAGARAAEQCDRLARLAPGARPTRGSRRSSRPARGERLADRDSRACLRAHAGCR